MPSIGWSEMLMLVMVAIVVVGPKELPRLMRVVGHWMGKARAAAREFQQAFDEMAREADHEDLRRKMAEVHKGYMSDIYGEDEPAAPGRAQAADGEGGGPPPAGSTGEKPGQSDGEGAAGEPKELKEPEESKKAEERPVPSH